MTSKMKSLVLGAAVLLLAGTALATGPQTQCPITGEKINKAVHYDYQGKRIYFCCPGCIDKFKQDPGKFMKEMADSGVELADAPKPQTTCPVMGGKIDKSVYYDYKGERVYFCCPGCIDKFKQDPEKYLEKMKDQGIELEKTPSASSDQPAESCPHHKSGEEGDTGQCGGCPHHH